MPQDLGQRLIKAVHELTRDVQLLSVRSEVVEAAQTVHDIPPGSSSGVPIEPTSQVILPV